MLKPKFTDMDQLVAEFNLDIRYLDRYESKDPTLLAETQAKKPVVESKKEEPKAQLLAEAAPKSMYTSTNKALDSFKILAGLETQEKMPWNPGIVAETRTVGKLMEDFGMMDEDDGEDQTPGIRYHKDTGGYSAKDAHKALAISHRTLATSHAHHEMMPHMDAQTQAHAKAKLAKYANHASYALKGAAMGAPEHIADKLHALADRHSRHEKIYMRGGRPKLEAIQEMIESIVGSIEEIGILEHVAIG